jgi:capsular exopolysaccharide synthesis family protein
MSRNFDLLYSVVAQPGVGASETISGASTGSRIRADDRSAGAEDEIFKLVQRTFLVADRTAAPRRVTFCGVEKGAGCSWVCARAAEALAEQTSERVCLIDANFRAPSLHAHFHFENGTGLADALSNSSLPGALARATWIPNLWLLTAGAIGAEPHVLLNPDRLGLAFASLRAEFDYVVIDTPALSVCTDAAVIGQLTDGAILVIGSNSTRRETARAAKENLVAAKVPMIGAVLNRRTYPIPRAIYDHL